MFLTASALVLLVRAGITSLSNCQYSDSTCTTEVTCLDVCATTSICAPTSSSTCDSMKSTYTATGMSEWGECYPNSGSYFNTTCTYEAPPECSEYDICIVSCTANNGKCGGTCTFVGQNVANSSELNCDNTQLLTHYTDSYSGFKGFGFSNCFTRTDTGQDAYLICNMGYPDSGFQFSKIVVPIVCIVAVYCCIFFVWRRSEAEDKKFWIARQIANTKLFGGSPKSTSTGTTKPI